MRGWIGIAIVAILLLFAFAKLAALLAHDWYPIECCSNQDCAPVDAVAFATSDGKSVPVMVITTKFGTKPVDAQTKIFDSKDGRMHACVYQGRLLCLFLPPGQ